MSSIIPVELQFTFRDGDQSNKGTKMSAAEFVAQAPNVHKYGVGRIQTGGGTFWAEPARAGRWPEQFNQTIGNHFGSGNLTLSALYRSVFGLSMKAQSLSSHEYTMKVLAEQGRIKVLQNFHGMNDVNLTGFVPKMAADHGMTAMAGLCVQVNENTMQNLQAVLDQHYRDVDAMLEQGHKGIYIKNANGILVPEFTEALFAGVRQRFGHQHEMGFHTHNTYGLAIENAMAAVRGNGGKGLLVVDCLPSAAADGTAQMSGQMFVHALKNSGDPLMVASVPKGIKWDVIEKDAPAQSMLRGTYHGNEMPYDPGALTEAKGACAAGGSIGVLKGEAGTRQTLALALHTDDWPTQRSAIYNAARAHVLKLFGFVTNVTPYQSTIDKACAQAVPAIQKGKSVLDAILLQKPVRDYAVGRMGRISPYIDPELQRRALEMEGLKEVVKPLKAEELPDGIAAAKEFLATQTYQTKDGKNVGLKDVTDAEAHIFAMIGNEWKPDCPARRLITETRNGTLSPLPTPELTLMMRPEGRLGVAAPLVFQVAYNALTIQKLNDGFYQGLPNKDNLIVGLEAENRKLLNEDIPNTFKKAGREKHALGRALQAVNVQLAEIACGKEGLGLSPEFLPQIPLNFSNRTFDEMIEVIGLDSIASAAEHLYHLANHEYEKIEDQVRDKILEVTQIPSQVEAALELFYKRVQARVEELHEAFFDGQNKPRPGPQ